MRVARVGLLGREENHVKAVFGQATLTRRLTQQALAPVPKDGIPQTLRRDEGDPTRIALVCLSQSYTQERIVRPLPTGEDLLKISLGLDGLLHVV